ncbi:MAG: hypothetical protein L0216_20530 [Planctomycetales bacterium]|nr:hypothetical protein [Planctomycetales bacterium]
MRRLIRSFERSGLEWLLVGGQATILYGAATFSEDVDVWIRPTPGNVRRLLRSLASLNARVHKLTPPLTATHIREGHGFHFVVPDRSVPTYLDVLGHPPRAARFAAALPRCRRIQSPEGPVPVAGMEDLVQQKRTRRPGDYEVISNLVRIRLLEETPPPARVARWAIRNTFRAEDLAEFVSAFPAAVGSRPAARLLRARPRALAAARAALAKEMAAAQSRDAAYWGRRVAALRRLRRAGRLLPEGLPVERLLARR